MRRLVFIPIFLSLFIVAGCIDDNENLKDYYLSLVGEGQHWRVKGYEIEISKDSFIAGNGFLDMKNVDSFMTNSFDIEVRAVIGDVDQVIQKIDRTGEIINIAVENTGKIKGDSYVDQEGNPITLEDIKKVYLVLKWHDLDKKKDLRERIDLYHANENNMS
ncbi:nitrite reductase [Oceanobacillus picturae]|uniref:Nitrite reductase n=1 Tax=Oceanobacillus picturae TaxID=171693 RepID=W9AJH8_9BACI|nr:hypothetical protein [Oceanobacillus picturae]RIU89412.1 hypothetical protein D1864_15505 [Oceanobacillus picturae]GAQ19010.1 nitrite reductase [Oceanobacillus picturae]CDO02831.1 hypothetical protein BN988_01309 [Oceanobacillus picturae]